MQHKYTEHHASVIVNASVHQVYNLFTHFNDFPKFMSFVKEVTYYDDQKSHWVADIIGQHKWDAINEEWIPDQQIGWHSISGLDNFGKVTFTANNVMQTTINVWINYKPPIGIIGEVGEKLLAGERFQQALQNDLTHFARMVDEAPVGALDPHSSSYLFHPASAVATGTVTERQQETMKSQAVPQPGIQPLLDQDITGTTTRELARKSGQLPDLSATPTQSVRDPLQDG